ncbi:predicted protein [Nematostella vectensis]|uniref:EF-hand domain-containing protein n=1 Tax=Nematostella vectensis TaxID=45351 RepID=A7SCU4_NEMVE|nr:divergent protein kinase domain 1B [Nematostella vectensis]EDO38496.1 predicted protein [Nematostella vectensis]|eukprot:XP_001630559.1 predicted protein [Nematostella vectensis]
MPWSAKYCFGLGGAVVLSIAFFYLIEFYFECNQSHIDQLCKEYDAGQVTGNLCHSMCSEKSVLINRCLTGQGEKKVHSATWNGREVVLKFFTTFQNYTIELLEPRYEITQYILSLFGRFDQCEKCQATFDQILDIADVDRDGKLSALETKSILDLLHTPEPRLLLILNGSKHSPNIYGYCGRLYAVENIPHIADILFGLPMRLDDLCALPFILEPVENFIRSIIYKYYNTLEKKFMPMLSKIQMIVFVNILQLRVPNIEERFNYMHSVLDGLLELNSNPFGLLQSCDVHNGNFGLTDDAPPIAKFIDLDLTYTKYTAEVYLESTSCSSNSDCTIGDFKECASKCNTETGYCNSKLLSQDVQNICLAIVDPLISYVYQNFNKDPVQLRCFQVAVESIREYCVTIPVYDTFEDLVLHTGNVKKMLKDLQEGKYRCNSN